MPYPGPTTFPGPDTFPGLEAAPAPWVSPLVWLDPRSPAVRAAVVSGAWGKLPHSAHFAVPPTTADEIDVIADVLETASEQLTSLTAGAVHPALQVVEDFVCESRVSRLTPSVQPVHNVVALQAVSDAGLPGANMGGWVLFGGSLRFTDTDTYPSLNYQNTYLAGEYGWVNLAVLWPLWFGTRCQALQRLRLTYNTGSTVTAAARRAVLSLAHELYLQVSPCDECGSCRLPLRTTNVIREGLSINIADPLDPTQASGSTGLPEVDQFVRTLNPRQVSRGSAVFTADDPPPVTHSLVSARSAFPPDLNGFITTSAVVTASGVVS